MKISFPSCSATTNSDGIFIYSTMLSIIYLSFKALSNLSTLAIRKIRKYPPETPDES